MTGAQVQTATSEPKSDSAWLESTRARTGALVRRARALGCFFALVGGQVPPKAVVAAVSLATLTSVGCRAGVGRAAVSLSLAREKSTPKDASVFIDEEFIGPLTFVAAHGVRLPVGEHRITIEKAGYFPWDRLVVADRQPIKLDVQLEPIPD
ncbi:MAG TPA: PEGA domain-containing protein [Polyangiaceae bacterium]|nr:PEGA domain-containing protein [Polyangiaceae bacterium]